VRPRRGSGEGEVYETADVIQDHESVSAGVPHGLPLGACGAQGGISLPQVVLRGGGYHAGVGQGTLGIQQLVALPRIFRAAGVNFTACILLLP